MDAGAELASRSESMPYVNVKITKGGVTTAQKRRLVEEITASLVSTLGKKPEHIHIVIDEVDPENWGYAGMLTTDYRARIRRERAAAKPKPGSDAGKKRG
jgi:4-oxalocrotonate tautomerase